MKSITNISVNIEVPPPAFYVWASPKCENPAWGWQEFLAHWNEINPNVPVYAYNEETLSLLVFFGGNWKINSPPPEIPSGWVSLGDPRIKKLGNTQVLTATNEESDCFVIGIRNAGEHDLSVICENQGTFTLRPEDMVEIEVDKDDNEPIIAVCGDERLTVFHNQTVVIPP